jgi:hypothetical protein
MCPYSYSCMFQKHNLNADLVPVAFCMTWELPAAKSIVVLLKMFMFLLLTDLTVFVFDFLFQLCYLL